MKSILVLGKGDTQYSDRNRARFVDYARKAGFDVLHSDYHELKQVPALKAEAINVMFFFPFTFWNANCEVPEDTRLYGTSRSVYEKFRGHFLQVGDELGQKFNGQKLHYVIPPEIAALDRDKVGTIDRLRAHGVPTSEPVPYASVDEIVGTVTPERGVFIKCRYGADGKGITVLHHDRWVTNYKVEGNGLANHRVYGLWPFTDITGRKDLLGQLIQHDVIVEQEILISKAFNGKKFDVRAYVVNQNMPHFFVRVNDPEREVTNYSQGAIIRHHPNSGLNEKCMRVISQVSRRAAEA